MTTDRPDSSDAIDRASRIIADSLAQALMEAEVILAADRDARPRAIPAELLDALERFSSVLERLVDHTEQLAERVGTLAEAVNVLARQPQPGPGTSAKPQLPEMESAFAPGGEGIDVVISAVPGFQGLMDLQRSLVRLPQVSSAAVRRYQDDEAAIQLVLQQPMTPSQIAQIISESTDQRIFVDEARPDALRLKLRFIAG